MKDGRVIFQQEINLLDAWWCNLVSDKCGAFFGSTQFPINNNSLNEEALLKPFFMELFPNVTLFHFDYLFDLKK